MTSTKHTALNGDTKIEITVRLAGKQAYAACEYPLEGLPKGGNPYARTGARTGRVQTPMQANEKAALDNILDLLEKKLGKRPVLSK